MVDPKPAFIALGDIHLNPYIWNQFRQITGDTFLSLEGLIRQAIEFYVPLILVGDVFDTIKPSPEVLQFFRRQMDRCQEEGVEVYALQGNHDRRTTPWYVACHDHVRHIGDGQPVEIGGLRCVGFDYALKDEIYQQIDNLNAMSELPQVLLLHQACRQALRFEGRWNCDLEWVPEGIPLVVMGDIHTPWEMEVRKGQWAYYTGPGSARDISQAGPKSSLMVCRDLSVERLELPYREIRKFRFTAQDQIVQLQEWMDDVLKTEQPLPPVAWVVFTPECDGEVRRLLNERDGQVQAILESVEAVEDMDFDDPTDRQEIDDLISVEALLERLVKQEDEPFTYQFVLDLLEPEVSILDVIKTRREQFTEQQTEGAPDGG